MSKSCLRPVAIFFEVMMKRTLLLCAFLVGLVSSNVMALTLDEARTQGQVGKHFMVIWLR